MLAGSTFTKVHVLRGKASRHVWIAAPEAPDTNVASNLPSGLVITKLGAQGGDVGTQVLQDAMTASEGL